MLCSASVALRWVKLWWFGVGDRSPVTPKDDDSVAASQNCLAPLSLSYLSTPNGLGRPNKGQQLLTPLKNLIIIIAALVLKGALLSIHSSY